MACCVFCPLSSVAVVCLLLLSCVFRPVSSVRSLLSCVFCTYSSVLCPLSSVLCLLSSVLCPLSSVLCPLFSYIYIFCFVLGRSKVILNVCAVLEIKSNRLINNYYNLYKYAKDVHFYLEEKKLKFSNFSDHDVFIVWGEREKS